MNIKKGAALLMIPLLLNGCANMPLTETPSASDINTTTVTAVTTETAQKTSTEKIKKTIDEIPINYYGRVINEKSKGLNTVFFSWTNSGFEVSFEGTSLYADIEARTQGVQYLNVTVDKRKSVRVAVSEGGSIRLAEGLNAGVHVVKVEKATEPFGSLGLSALELKEGGRFLDPPAMPERKILFIGDSITAGYGNAKDTNEWTGYKTSEQDGSKTYEAYLCQHFSAQSQVLASSGRGIALNLDKTPSAAKEIFEGKDYVVRNITGDYSFDWVPDVTIINLGTNDIAAGATPDQVRTAATAYCRLIRSHYPKTHIIWTYGVINTDLLDTFKQTVEALNKAGDSNVYWQPLEAESPGGGIGIDGHPSAITHQKMADTLAPLIEKITGWAN